MCALIHECVHRAIRGGHEFGKTRIFKLYTEIWGFFFLKLQQNSSGKVVLHPQKVSYFRSNIVLKLQMEKICMSFLTSNQCL